MTDPEKQLRAIWTAKGVTPGRQDAMIADIFTKAQFGAKVGPFTLGCLRAQCRAPLACSGFGYCRIRNVE